MESRKVLVLPQSRSERELRREELTEDRPLLYKMSIKCAPNRHFPINPMYKK